jgi:GNAT superfamily N-acetyltransferase
MVRTHPDLVIRLLEEDDVEAAVELLEVAFGSWPHPMVLAANRPGDFFRWKHFSERGGRSMVVAAEVDGRLVAMRAYMPWPFAVGDRRVEGQQAVDLATHPDYRGRGITSALTDWRIERYDGAPPLTPGLPNDMSKRLGKARGWRLVRRVPLWTQVRRPLRVAVNLHRLRAQGPVASAPDVEAPRAIDCLGDAAGIEELLSDRAIARSAYRTAYDLDALRWRYDHVLADYRAVVEHDGGRLAGLAIFRLGRRGALWELAVCELMARPGDERTVRRLLRQVAGAARADHVAAIPGPSCSPALLARGGFVPSPVGKAAFGIASYGDHEPDPYRPDSWCLSLGDLERLWFC